MLRGRRVAWKGPFFKAFNLPKEKAPIPIAGAKLDAEVQMRTDCRNCTILPSFVGHLFHVHNGKSYVPVRVSEEMIGHRLGEFAPSKRVAIYKEAPKVAPGKGSRAAKK